MDTGYVRGHTLTKIWLYIVQWLHVRILEFPFADSLLRKCLQSRADDLLLKISALNICPPKKKTWFQALKFDLDVVKICHKFIIPEGKLMKLASSDPGLAAGALPVADSGRITKGHPKKSTGLPRQGRMHGKNCGNDMKLVGGLVAIFGIVPLILGF